MIDLSKQSGLPIQLDEKTYKLKFGDGLTKPAAQARMFSEIKSVLMDPEAKPEREEIYFMYRDVHKTIDEETIREHKVRYDITVLPPSLLGQEFVKTAGHYHSRVPGEDYEYPELYEVLYGNATFMIQKIDENGKVITVMVIHAGPGNKVIYPPNYGHIIINIGSTPLVTANWVSSEYTADYQSIASKHGMAYYIVKKGDSHEFVPNKNYGELPPIRQTSGHTKASFGFSMLHPMYETGVKHPDRLDFLNKPHKYAVELSTITS